MEINFSIATVLFVITLVGERENISIGLDDLRVHEAFQSSSHFLNLALLLLQLLILRLHCFFLGLNFVNELDNKLLELQVLFRMFVKLYIEICLDLLEVAFVVVVLKIEFLVEEVESFLLLHFLLL
jgi:hypothetical protein